MINNRHSNRGMAGGYVFIINYYETVSLNDSRCTFDDEIVGLSCVFLGGGG